MNREWLTLDKNEIEELIEKKRAEIYNLYEKSTYIEDVLEKSKELDELLAIYNKLEK